MDFPGTIKTILIANRGEIACRVIKTAKRLGIRSIAVFTPPDAAALHVRYADVAFPLKGVGSYLEIAEIIDVARAQGADALHPGYGFLSENTDLAHECDKAGIQFLGPNSDAIKLFGVKHAAREQAVKSNVPCVPGTGLIESVDEALAKAKELTFPVMLKATGGGGGIGLNICASASELKEKFPTTKRKAETQFKDGRLFLEKYYPQSRHIEVQVLGNGKTCIHFGERECSIQRRHQKIIEEAPSPFLLNKPDLRQEICAAAVRLCASIGYENAGTVEFLVDDKSGKFFFLEVNTRLQVEHPITEAITPGLDLVELMIAQGAYQRAGKGGIPDNVLSQWQDKVNERLANSTKHAIEARVYAENPCLSFRPSPGLLQYVQWPKGAEYRIDTWVETGTQVSGNYDPLLAKVISTGSDCRSATEAMAQLLTKSKVYGPPNNIEYMLGIIQSEDFAKGQCLTAFTDTFAFTPSAIQVMSGSPATSIQDYPGRMTGHGIPRGGAMDWFSHRIANLLAGNEIGDPTLEITFSGPELLFHVAARVAIAGCPIPLKVNGNDLGSDSFRTLDIAAGDKLKIGFATHGPGNRAYLAVRGGFTNIADYLGSKSTSAGLGGYQARNLTTGDFISIPPLKDRTASQTLAKDLQPRLTSQWEIRCMKGPHDDPTFFTQKGSEQLYTTSWEVSSASNRMGIRLLGPVLDFARNDGGEGGNHPSNIHDYGYPFCALNINGDQPVILTSDGPSCGGFLCPLTIISADTWKTGQLRPGDKIIFRPVSRAEALHAEASLEDQFSSIRSSFEGKKPPQSIETSSFPDAEGSIIDRIGGTTTRPIVTYRQGGDSCILIEYGDLILQTKWLARLKVLQDALQAVRGIHYLSPCVRSLLVCFDRHVTNFEAVLQEVKKAESSLPDSSELKVKCRKVTLPMVFDDQWSKEAITRYARTVRSTAPYIPSNIDYIARSNGLEDGYKELQSSIFDTLWLTVAVNFYQGAPFLIPLDPSKRQVASKYNPSRTYTAEGAIGIGGLCACIYPFDSPGGYQLFGRTLPMWSAFSSPTKPWLLNVFDLIQFTPVEESEYEKALILFKVDAALNVKEHIFDMKEHLEFEQKVDAETRAFKSKQSKGAAQMIEEEKRSYHAWQESLALEAKQKEEKGAQGGGDSTDDDSVPDGAEMIPSPMTANLWKLLVKVGDVLTKPDKRASGEDQGDDDDAETGSGGPITIGILEAMKTEIPITVDDDLEGKTVVKVAVKEGEAVEGGSVICWVK